MRRIHYAWVIAAVTFIALMGAAGFRSTPGILIVPLEHEFGWNRAVISVAVSINLILFGLTGPFAAALMDRFGLRAVTVGALITVASGALLTTLMTSPWELYLLWGWWSASAPVAWLLYSPPPWPAAGSSTGEASSSAR